MENKIEQLDTTHLFSAPVYRIKKPEFLDAAREVSKKFISKRKCEKDLDPIYPVYMTESLNFDPEMADLSNYIIQTAWNILESQGYAMDIFSTYFMDMWCQEHHKGSSMDRHIHGHGAVISGFYFLDCPQESSRVVFHHPHEAKVISNLPEKNVSDISHASNMVNFKPEEGLLILANSWLPHSFSRNTSKKPVRFIHFNIAVAPMVSNQSCEKPQAEVV